MIVAGGKGLRMGSKIKKQYMKYAGFPVLVHTLKNFASFPMIDGIILVVPEEDMAFCHDNILVPHGLDLQVSMVKGGRERHDSVKNGLLEVKKQASFSRNVLVMIHDGVRPFADHLLMKRCITGAIEHQGACVPAVPVHDTLKKTDRHGFVLKTVARDHLHQVQTPQVFDLDLIIGAYDHAEKNNFSGTDDASFVENAGKRVFMTRGSKKNIKITTREDFYLADAFHACLGSKIL